MGFLKINIYITGNSIIYTNLFRTSSGHKIFKFLPKIINSLLNSQGVQVDRDAPDTPPVLLRLRRPPGAINFARPPRKFIGFDWFLLKLLPPFRLLTVTIFTKQLVFG